MLSRLLIVAILLSAGLACKRAGSLRQPTASEARVAVQNVIRGQLMSPGVVHFSTEQEMNIDELGSGRFRVRGFVDYQGRFDLAVRNNYTCLIRYTDRGQWEVEEIKWE